MAALKEIKSRINSVQNTLKITSAMKIVASTKLKKAEQAISGMRPYEQKMDRIVKNFLASEGSSLKSPYMETRKEEKVAVVALASNSSLCGAFNSTVIRKATSVLEEFDHLHKRFVVAYPIGRRVQQALSYRHDLCRDYCLIGDKPNYQEAARLADELMTKFLNKELDRVELVYMHFKSAGSQELVRETFLPLQLPEVSAEAGDALATDYIVEPDKLTVLRELLPQWLKLKIYTVLLDSSASEHAARTIAMQQATDNGNDLLHELQLAYNKGRQQAITSELLDIIGGSLN